MIYFNNFDFMLEAIKEAKIAGEAGEWPVGVVITYNGNIIARAHNLVEKMNNPCAHAEILAVEEARRIMYERYGEKFLDGCELYVTLEPCKMCLEYLRNIRIGKIIYGAKTEKRDKMKIEVLDCIYEEECEELLREFGRQLRRE